MSRSYFEQGRRLASIPLKIVILSFVFPLPPRGVGGSELAADSFAQNLAKRGHEIHVITQREKGQIPFEEREGFSIHRLRRLRVRFVGAFLYSIAAYLEVRKIRPDIIHEQGTLGFALFINRLSRIPYIVYERGNPYRRPKFYRRFVMAPNLKYSSVVLALTNYMAGGLREICNREVLVLPNGVDLARFDALSRDKARIRLGIGENEKVALFVGNINPVKGVEYLIEGMGSLAGKFPQARLFIVGRDMQNGKIQHLVRERNLQAKVVFTGFVPPAQIPQYMIAADVFVLPSVTEGFPNVLLEAMAAGLPLVSTDVCGLPEIVEDGENGLLVPPEDPQGLAEAISRLLDDEDLRKRMGKNARKRAESHFGWDVITGRLEEIYNSVVSKG